MRLIERIYSVDNLNQLNKSELYPGQLIFVKDMKRTYVFTKDYDLVPYVEEDPDQHNLEKLIRDFPEYGEVVGSEYILKVVEEIDNKLHIYIRPSNRNGITLDFWIEKNKLTSFDE